jgi:hypothetical protein
MSVHQNRQSEPSVQKFNIRTAHRQQANFLCMFLLYTRVYASVNKVPDVGSDVLQHVAHYCMVFECFV